MTSTEIQLNDPQTLHRRWEDSQWSPFEIDLGRDREQWGEMSDADRDPVYWALSSLIVAEERITTKFSGLVGAHGSEEEATFLATQQVDETRHIGYGVWFLREAVRDQPAAAPTIRATLGELLPLAAESLTLPDGHAGDALGAGADEIREYALSGLSRRLEIIGAPLDGARPR